MSFAKTYYIFSGCMGVYGFSRGWRCKDNTLYADKAFMGILNGISYAAPIYNIFPLMRTCNRIQIEYQNLDKNKYETQYTEIGSFICHETI